MIVLDCSAGIEIARNTKRGQAFCALMLPEEEIVAPVLYRFEAANVAWKYVHADVLNKQQAKGLMEDALALPDRFAPCDDMDVEALALAASVDHSAYDAYYLVLARRNDATLMTVDARMREMCLDLGISCVCEVGF